MAERLRHGLYGLNAGEPTSPSSSILWPLLFVPFAGTAFLPWAPLVVNIACGALAAWLLGLMVADSFLPAHRASDRWKAFVLAALLVLAFNLLGLTYTGLEHSLEVLLCVACASAAVRATDGQDAGPDWDSALDSDDDTPADARDRDALGESIDFFASPTPMPVGSPEPASGPAAPAAAAGVVDWADGDPDVPAISFGGDGPPHPTLRYFSLSTSYMGALPLKGHALEVLDATDDTGANYIALMILTFIWIRSL